MNRPRSLNNSISTTIAANLLVQWIIYWILFSLNEFSQVRAVAFAVVSLLIHMGVAALLIRLKSMFKRVEDQRALDKVNLANILTLFRLLSLPTILFLVIEWDRGARIGIPLLVFMVVAFLTDLFDGMASRKSGTVTEIGKVLDSFADYMSLYVLTISFFVVGIISPWLFVLVMLRGLMVWTGLAVLALRYGSLEVTATKLGKVSIFAIMTLIAFEIAAYLIHWLAAQHSLVMIVEGVASVIIVISMVDKIRVFIATALKARPIGT